MWALSSIQRFDCLEGQRPGPFGIRLTCAFCEQEAYWDKELQSDLVHPVKCGDRCKCGAAVVAVCHDHERAVSSGIDGDLGIRMFSVRSQEIQLGAARRQVRSSKNQLN
jgi:hypothetical protein